MDEKIRVLVVDDSAFMRKMLTDAIESDHRYKVIKTAKDGISALKAVEKLHPDVITLDIELPEIDGLTCLGYIMEKFPTPVVMVTGFSEFLGEETIKALEYGAVGFVRKPKGPISLSMQEIKQDLLSKIELSMQIDVKKLIPVAAKKDKGRSMVPIAMATDKIVAIASSSGGPRALSQIIPMLPADLPAAVLVIQHMPSEFMPSFAKRLDWESSLQVKVAEDGEPVQQGKVLIAPDGFHCRIESNADNVERIKLVLPSKEEDFLLISANESMVSLAPIYGRNAVGVVLTGMGNDGTEGLQAIKKYGGYTIAEHESTAIVNGMPKAAIEAGVIDEIFPLDKITDEIVKAVTENARVKNENIRI